MKYFEVLLFAVLLQLPQQQYATKTSIDEIIAQNKGKIIVIDYWASWCKPCRKEMPAMKSLMKKYKNSDIAFVFISMDIDQEKWKEAAEKEGIAEEPYSYMSFQIKKTDLSKTLKGSSIPNYVIFDKNGTMVNADAPRPTSKKLQAEIDKYLNH